MVGGDTIAMHLNSGVPVVHIMGIWNDATERLLQETVSRLVGAGHMDIVVNLANLRSVPGSERGWLDGLGRMAAAVRSRCGRLDVVATVEQIGDGLRRQAQTCWRWATSEEEAICRVKGIPNGICAPFSIVKATLS